MFDGMENRIAQIVFGIPAVKGLEFGAGFDAARMHGSECNDPFVVRNGKIETDGNNCGGILGGISNGMPLVFRTAVKPTPTIRTPRRTVSLASRSDTEITVQGRHDPAIAPRAAIVQTAVTALVVCDLLTEAEG
jgi:chorismate synthase